MHESITRYDTIDVMSIWYCMGRQIDCIHAEQVWDLGYKPQLNNAAYICKYMSRYDLHWCNVDLM